MIRLPEGSTPLLSTTLIHRLGTLGMALLPALIVERELSSQDSAWVMSVTKAGMIVGTLFGGWCLDRAGLLRTLFLSFALGGIGLIFTPLVSSVTLLAAFAFLAQLGHAMYPATVRLLLLKLVPRATAQREALGWLRTVNNLGQIVSFGLGALFSRFGILPLLWFDAFTSFAAIAYGRKKLPLAIRQAEELSPTPAFQDSPNSAPENWLPLILTGALAALFSFHYETFMVTSAAVLKIQLGQEGVRAFSLAMITNTTLCAFLAVRMTRLFQRPEIALPTGLIFAALANGFSFSSAFPRTLPVIFFGMLLLTVGELIFFALSSYTILRLIPPSSRQGRIHSAIILVQISGRLLGAALAFPVFVHGHQSERAVAASLALGILIVLFWLPRIRAHQRLQDTRP